MSLILYVQCFASALLGWIIYTAAKMKSLDSKSNAANAGPVSIIPYLRENWLSVAISMATILLVLLCLGEIAQVNPKIMDYVKLGFAFVGYTSGDVMGRIFGAADKRLNKLIDEKTNIADKK